MGIHTHAGGKGVSGNGAGVVGGALASIFRKNVQGIEAMHMLSRKQGETDFQCQLRQRQKDRIHRVKIATVKAQQKSAIALLLYFFIFAFIYTNLCTKLVDCDTDYDVMALAEDDSGFYCTQAWTFIDSIYFVVVTTTTVGYGDLNMMDQPTYVQLLFVLQSTIGFVLGTFLVVEIELTSKRAELADGNDFIVRSDDEESHPDDDYAAFMASFRRTCAQMIVIAIIATTFYCYQQGMDLKHSIYFVYVSTTTIGFGDIVVESDIAKLFTCVFLMFGCICFANMVGMVSTAAQEDFKHGLLQKMLCLEHDASSGASSIDMFDYDGDGFLTSGQFLMGYLVTLGRSRTITCKEIIEKFEQIALGESLLDLSLFKNRMKAVADGKAEGEKVDKSLALSNPSMSVEERAVRAGAAAAKGAGLVDSVVDDELPKVVKERNAEKLSDNTGGVGHAGPITETDLIDEVTRGARNKNCLLNDLSIEDIDRMENTLDAILSRFHTYKNDKVKIALAAGEAAGLALAGGEDNLARVPQTSLSRIATFTKQACLDAGGSSREQNVSARNVVIKCAKALGYSYKLQQEIADEHAGLSFSEVEPQDLKEQSVNTLVSSFTAIHNKHKKSADAPTTAAGLRFGAAMQKAKVSNVDTPTSPSSTLGLRPHDSLL